MNAPQLIQDFELDSIMQKRGILQVVREWGWQPSQLYGRNGWEFAIEHPDLNLKRWKAGDGAKPKYLWYPAKPENVTPYYLPADTLESIKAKKGVVFCEGETDMAALYACGVHNVACWWDGASSIPASIVSDVQAWGCTRVTFIPDLDETGLKAGVKFYELFKDSGLEVILRRIPNGFNDVNDLLEKGAISPEKHNIPVWDIAELYDYVEMMKGEVTERATPTFAHPDSGMINPAVVEALRRAALNQGGKPQKHKGYEAIPVYAPRVLNHKRDSLGEHCYFYPAICAVYDYAKKTTVLGMQLCREWGIDIKAVGGFYAPDYTPSKIIPMPQLDGVAFNTEPPLELPTIPTPDGIIKPRREILKDMREYLTDPKKQGVGAIPNPFPCLAQFEGFGEMLGKGKVILFGAPSGAGKTVSVEMAVEQALKDGLKVLMWSGEWTNDEHGIRAIQQNGGATLNDFYRDSAQRDWAENGGVRHQSIRPMTRAQKEASLKAIAEIEKLPGEVYCFDSEYADIELKTTFEIMGGGIQTEKIDFVIFDYAQLAPKDPDFKNGMAGENAFNQFKALCIKYKVAGMMTTQINKDATEKIERGEQLGAADFNGIRIDRANLPLGFWRITVGNEELPVLVLRILKNNNGRKGYVYLDASNMSSLRIDFTNTLKPSEVRRMIQESQVRQGLDDQRHKPQLPA